jgi:GNAT superfamily N-acetyltransferase
VWEIFRKYHYLNTELHQASEQWVGIINGELVCHTGIIQFPMRKGWKRVHRLVVLPDYQGIGIGLKFINTICKYYKDNNWNINLTTTTPSLVHTMAKSKEWNLIRYGRSSNTPVQFERYGIKSSHFKKTISNKRITYSFNYKYKGGIK